MVSKITRQNKLACLVIVFVYATLQVPGKIGFVIMSWTIYNWIWCNLKYLLNIIYKDVTIFHEGWIRTSHIIEICIFFERKMFNYG